MKNVEHVLHIMFKFLELPSFKVRVTLEEHASICGDVVDELIVILYLAA